VQVLVDGVDSARVEAGGSSLDAVDLVSFAEKEFGEIRAVLESITMF
jgi:acyl carrier protein